jgi:hypothetical protein
MLDPMTAKAASSAKGRLVPDPIRLVVVKNGREWPGCQRLDPGTRIASRWYDIGRKCYVVELAVDGVPPSAEVQASESWNC